MDDDAYDENELAVITWLTKFGDAGPKYHLAGKVLPVAEEYGALGLARQAGEARARTWLEQRGTSAGA